jgi:hypothetical protein
MRANEPEWSQLFSDEDRSLTSERLNMARQHMGG